MKKFLTLGVISVIIVSCTTDSRDSAFPPKNLPVDIVENCITYEYATVISANVPSTGNLNQTIPIDLKFGIKNGCGGFGNITETNSGLTKTLSINSKYEGCVCTQVAGVVQTTYNFTSASTGINIIKFAQPDGTFLSYSINIQ